MADNKTITPEDFEKEMAKIFQGGDTETNHGRADFLMCKVLRELGYGNGVKIFEDNPKWYA